MVQDSPARGAFEKVTGRASGAHGAKSVPDECRKIGAPNSAGGVGGLLHVKCQIGIAQPLARPKGQRRGRVGIDPELLAHLTQRTPFDGDPPHRQLPADRQACEGRGEQLRLQAQGAVRLLGGHAGRALRGLQVVGGEGTRMAACHVSTGGAYGGDEVGAKRDARTAASFELVDDLGEGFGHHVIDVAWPACSTSDVLGQRPVRGIQVGKGLPVTRRGTGEELVFAPLKIGCRVGSGCATGVANAKSAWPNRAKCRDHVYRI